jgi:predicted PurR-regulated permease PerM
MTEKIDDKTIGYITQEGPEIVPDDQIPHWRRYAVLAAVLLPLLICFSLYIHLFLDALLAVLPPFAIALILALLLDPIVDRMETYGIRRTLAVAVVFLIFLGGLTVIAVVGVPAIVGQASSLGSKSTVYFANMKLTVNKFLVLDHTVWNFQFHRTSPGNWLIKWRDSKVTTIHLPKNFDVLSQQLGSQLMALLQRSLGSLPVVLAGSVSTLFDLLIVLIVGFYLLVDIDRMRARFYYLTPEKYRKRVAEIGKDVGQVFADYVRGLFVVCVMYGIATTVLLYALAYMPHFGRTALAQYALLIGASAGVLYAIPYIGSLTVGLLTFLVALAAGDFGFAVFAVFATLVLNQTFDNIIAPRVVGGGVGLNPVVVIFSLSLGGALFQFWGLLLSVPIAGSVQAILFRLIPKLTTPTPRAFLVAHGISPAKGESLKLTPAIPDDVKQEEAAERGAENEKLALDIAAENAEAPQ